MMLVYVFSSVVDNQIITGGYLYVRIIDFCTVVLKFSIVRATTIELKFLSSLIKYNQRRLYVSFSVFPTLEPYKHTIPSIFHNMFPQQQ